MPVTHDTQYIRQVVETSESHVVTASEEIYSDQGVKLVTKGTRIDKSVYEKLVRFKLLRPIDTSLNIENGVTSSSLMTELDQLAHKEFVVQFLQRTFPDPLLPSKIFSKVYINSSLSVKLTVTRERAPEKFRHSILVALGALYLGNSRYLDHNSLVDLVTAGLFHDLGEMHLDPKLLDRNQKPTSELRRQIFAHPIVIYMILREFPQYHPEISRAVLEHHERLDGTGYPSGLKESEISELGRILAVAELMVVMLERASKSPDWDYLSTSMKLNVDKYDESLVHLLVELFKRQQTMDGGRSNATKQQTLQLWRSLASIFEQFPETNQGQSEGSAEAFVFHHTSQLRFQISRAGIEPAQAALLVEQLNNQDVELVELLSIAKESIYRLHELLNEVYRRWPSLVASEQDGSPLQRWLHYAMEQIDYTSPPLIS